MKWKAQKTSARAVPSGGSSHSSPAEQATKATMMQTKSSSEASSFNNLMVSSMKSQCSGPASAQPRRSAVSRHRQWPSSPPLSRLVTGWCNGTQISQNECVQLSNKEPVQAQGSMCRGIPLFLVHFHRRPRGDRGITKKQNLSLPRNVYCVRIEQGLPPRSDAHDAEAIDLPQETSDPK